ncbi:MAG TPA: nucleotide exchange factor GrpE [Mycobacteriales bacterium]|jgi:molecular chaperone GrpE
MSTREEGENAEAVVRTVPAETDSAPSTPGEEQSEEAQAVAIVGELEDRWRRAVADLDNLRKRYARDLERERAAERSRVAAAWLPVVDNLELALAHAGGGSDPIVAGVRAVRDQAVEVLARLGFPRHDEIGLPFDPTRHEVVAVVEDPDAEPGTVVQVVRPGYGDGENQLRPAAVTVSRRQGG